MNKQENKILRSVVRSYSRNRMPVYARMPFVVISSIGMIVLLVAVKRLLVAGEINIYVTFSILLFSGVAIGFVSIVRASYKCQPFIKPYLDLSAIEQKLSDADKRE
ncbi:hypothetical protein ACJJIW_20715 [Microbulbifer sp. JMSA004]|uniref:hypothetical protein n=1 Tax=Microbulbifer sp. JMSA004 TaxID=3243370 RepID=UPI004039BB9B